MLLEIILSALLVFCLGSLENGWPNKKAYSCPLYCATHHKHLAFGDTVVVSLNMANNGNTNTLGGFFDLIAKRQGTEIDALPSGNVSFDNLKELKRNRGGFLDSYKQAKRAKDAALTDMRDEGISEEIISSVMPTNEPIGQSYEVEPEIGQSFETIVNPPSDKAFETKPADNTRTSTSDPFVKAANNEWLMESAEEGLPSTDEYLKSQYNRLYDGGYDKDSPSWEDFKKNLGDFAHRTSGIESDYGKNLNELGGTTSAKGLYQFTDASVGTGKNRLLNMGVSQDVVDKIDANPLNWSKDQSDMMFFGNLFPRGGSDDLFKKIAKGDKGAMKELYSKYHHTDESHKETQERAEKFFN
jgi:hypothetical protein